MTLPPSRETTMHRCPRLLPLVTSVVLFAVLGAPPARAADKPPGLVAATSDVARIAELNEAGSAYYAAGDYRLAIEKFVEAYAIDHDSNLLFNLGRCYERLGETRLAIEKYEAFVAAPGADAEGRLRAESSLAALRRLRAEELRSRAEFVPEPDRAPHEPSAPPASGHGARAILPWVALGGGVAIAAAGAVVYVFGARDHDKVTSAPGYGDPHGVHPMTEAEAERYVRSGNTKKLLGGLGLGLGGALVGTSAVLFFTGAGRETPGERGSVAVALDAGPEGGTLALFGSF